MTDSMGLGKLVRHMQNPSYINDEYLICIGLVPSISSVICKNPSYSGLSYPSSPVVITPMGNQVTGENPIPGSRLVYFFFSIMELVIMITPGCRSGSRLVDGTWKLYKKPLYQN